MTGLALLITAAAIGFGLSKRLRIPVIPLLLAMGMSLSFLRSVAPGDAMDEALAPEYLEGLLELGLAFLVFAAGIELNPLRFKNQKKAVWLVGLTQFGVAGAAGFGLAHALGFAGLDAFYLAIAVSTSSTLVVIRQLRIWLRMFEPFGRMVTGALLLQDLLMIVWLVMLAHFGEKNSDLMLSVASLLGLGTLAILCQARFMPWLLLRMRSQGPNKLRLEPGDRPRLDEESLLLVVLSSLFIFAGGARFLGLPPVVGAFFAGFSLSSFPLNGVARGALASLSDFFLAIFFTALGALIVIPEFALVLRALALALTVILLTPPLVAIIAEISGLSARAAIESGLLLAQTSELSLVLALTGVVSGHIDHDLFSAIALIAVATMAVTPLVANDSVVRRLLHLHPSRQRPQEDGVHEDHVLILGFGTGGMWVVKPLRKAGHNILVIDDDPAVITQLEKQGIPCLRGDGADEKVLLKANVAKAKLILAGMRRVQDAAKLLELVRDTPVLVRVFEDRDADAIQALGGVPILNSEAAAETFAEWFEKSSLAARGA